MMVAVRLKHKTKSFFMGAVYLSISKESDFFSCVAMNCSLILIKKK